MNKKILLGICLSLLLQTGVAAQSQEKKLEDMIKKIDKKVKLDQDYLDMYSLSFEPSVFADKEFKILLTSKGDTLDLSTSPGGQVTYRIGFIREGVALDSMVFLYIDKTTRDTASAAGGGLGRGGASREEKTERIYYFKDFYASKKKDHQKYITLYKFLEDFIEEKELQSLQEGKIRSAEPKSTLGIDPNDDIRTKEGMSSRNNDDFLNFQRVNNIHKYPIYADEGAKNKRRGGGAAGGVNPLNVDLNFASLTVAHEKLKLGPGLASFHFSVADRNLNLLPWESGYFHAGLRFLISSNGDLNDMREQFLMDIKVMARVGMDMKSISGNLPFLMTDEPSKINVGNGVTIDVATTRPFNNAPFLNFYFSTGSQDVTAPKIKLGTEDSSYWYSTFTQWEGFFSFFWNTNADLDGRFRMDLGVGSYDMLKTVSYISQTTKSVHDKIKPLIGLSFNWVIKESDNTYSEKLGINLKFFDSRLSALLWFKLLEFQPDHMIRFETYLIPEPIFRSPYEWESPGGVMFSIRYRYGFPVLSSISK